MSKADAIKQLLTRDALFSIEGSSDDESNKQVSDDSEVEYGEETEHITDAQAEILLENDLEKLKEKQT